MSEQIITVKYQTKKEYCGCCGKPYENAELSDFREFDISLDKLVNWTDWEVCCEESREYVHESVEEYVTDTINFFALNSNERLHISNDEVNKITDFIMNKFGATN